MLYGNYELLSSFLWNTKVLKDSFYNWGFFNFILENPKKSKK